MNKVPLKRVRNYLLLIGVFALSIWNCSGLQFPMWNAHRTLTDRLALCPKVSLPAGTSVVHAVRVATRDPAEYYELTFPPATVMQFIAPIFRLTKVEERDPAGRWSMGSLPAWWTPQQIRQVQRIDFFDQQQNSGYIVYYSPGSPRMFLFWFST